MIIEKIIKRHPLTGYFVLTFLISWLGSFLIGGPEFLRGEILDFDTVMLMSIPILAGPSLSGILMIYFTDGKHGLSTLFSSMKTWRIGVRWYITLLIFPALLVIVSVVLVGIVSKEFTPNFLGIGILLGLFAGFIEETGWTGFAYPRMRVKHGVLLSCLYLGIIHGVWHFMGDFLGNYGSMGDYWLPYFTSFVIYVTALRFLIVWVYQNTNSLLIAQLMHASSTGFFVSIVPLNLAPANQFMFYGIYAAVICITAVIIVLKYGRNLNNNSTSLK